MQIRISIESTQPLTGTAATEKAEPVHFDGWLELLRVISELVATPPRRRERRRGAMTVAMSQPAFASPSGPSLNNGSPMLNAARTASSANDGRDGSMRIGLIGIFVDDQDKAERFYTEVLGLKAKTSAAYGPGERWLTVVSPEEPDGVELVLHLTDEPARVFRQASREMGRPVFSLRTDDCRRDAERLKARGVEFVREPARMDYGGMDAVFDDTCGNLVNLHQD